MIYLHHCRVSTPQFQRCLHNVPWDQPHATGGLLAPRSCLVICTATPWTCCPAGHLYAMSRQRIYLCKPVISMGGGSSNFWEKIHDFLHVSSKVSNLIPRFPTLKVFFFHTSKVSNTSRVCFSLNEVLNLNSMA